MYLPRKIMPTLHEKINGVIILKYSGLVKTLVRLRMRKTSWNEQLKRKDL